MPVTDILDLPSPRHDDCPLGVRELRESAACVRELSKDAAGDLRLLDRRKNRCRTRECETLTTVGALTLDLTAHAPCDRGPLDGRLVAPDLTQVFAGGDPARRAIHAAGFTWAAGTTLISGTLSGVTNAGVVRAPDGEGCEECLAPGTLTGRLCGRVVRTRSRELAGCRVLGVYRLRAESLEREEAVGVTGAVEAVLVCPCADPPTTCVAFDAATAASGPNPRVEPGVVITHRDAAGALDPGSSIDPGVGLRIGATTEIDLAAPAATVEVTTLNGQPLGPIVATAYDAAGAAVAVHTPGLAQPDTGVLAWPGITRVVLANPVVETYLVRVCFDRIGS